jgi:hypothetical protein
MPLLAEVRDRAVSLAAPAAAARIIVEAEKSEALGSPNDPDPYADDMRWIAAQISARFPS